MSYEQSRMMSNFSWWRAGEVAVTTGAVLATSAVLWWRFCGDKEQERPCSEALDARVKWAVRAAFAEARSEQGGRVYHSQDVKGLSDSDPSLFGVSIVSISGEQLSLGDASAEFLTQSTFKPLVFAFGLHALGSQVSTAVADTGCKGYRASSIEPDGRAHNALINSGALSVMHLLSQAGHSVADVVDFVQSLTAKGAPIIHLQAYQATLADSAHNLAFCRALGKHERIFPDSQEAAANAVDWYSQLDCLQTTCASFSTLGAALANSGVPVSGSTSCSQILSSENTSRVLSTMLSCGMYEASGTWSREIGIPAKSGVSGAIIAVVPGKFGIVSYSPRIDEEGNSVQGVAFFRALAKQLPELSLFAVSHR